MQLGDQHLHELPVAGGALVRRPADARGDSVTSATLSYDESHTYVRTASFDHAARPTTMTLPADPDWDSAGIDPSPAISGRLEYDRRGLPARALLQVGDLPEIPVVAAIEYLRDGLVSHIEYGELGGSPVIESFTDYDVRRRPVRMSTTRTPDPGALAEDLQAVSVVHDQRLEWDAASNLTALVDERLPIEWPAGFRPQTVEISHDSLYRVVGALFHYSTVDSDDADDTASDWRSEAAASNAVDPMRPEPAAMVGSASTGDRVRSLTWEWDWLGNMTEWTDDAQQFYERSIGAITNGQDISARPSALYVTSNLEEVGDGGGWVEVDYGDGGNVERLTVHGECVSGASTGHGTGRVLALSSSWICAAEQHFEYRWDELNRIVEARRWDSDGTGTWTFEARQRYRYDGANQRTVKESVDTDLGDSRVALYVYPGDFERRGLTRGAGEYEGVEDGGLDYATETQYLVAGARLVWDHAPLSATGDLDRNRRLTMGVSDLIGTTAASVDLLSGELLEVSTYYPNGARETLRTNSGAAVPLEPIGFTGKEADEDVGLVYFGERYLLARLGRWASADPLHVHASGGGEALNSYHYVSGNLLQARDPLGLDPVEIRVNTRPPGADSDEVRWAVTQRPTQNGTASPADGVLAHDLTDAEVASAEFLYVYDPNAELSFEEGVRLAGIVGVTLGSASTHSLTAEDRAHLVRELTPHVRTMTATELVGEAAAWLVAFFLARAAPSLMADLGEAIGGASDYTHTREYADEAARIRALGVDPDSGGTLREAEMRTAQRIEHEFGVRLGRAPSGVGDWVDEDMTIWDSAGGSALDRRTGAPRMDLPGFARSLERHVIGRGYLHTVVDYNEIHTSFHADVMRMVDEFRAANPDFAADVLEIGRP